MMNDMSLKAKIRKQAKQKNISAQAVLQSYLMNRFLLRLSESEYRDKFVVKGGMLISSIVGMADEIFVINVGGYIGSSTRSEIDYALATGRAVNYLENIN